MVKFGTISGEIANGVIKWKNKGGANPATALLHGIGTSANPSTSGTANGKFMEYWCQSSASSGDNRLMYLRYELSGGGGGETIRAMTTMTSSAGTAHGAHLSLQFGTSGALTGLGVATRATLHIPDDAAFTSGTLAAIQAEIWADGAASDPDGVTELSFMRVVAGGNATGIADIEDDAFLFSFQGFTSASGNMIYENTTADSDATIRVKIGSTSYYMMLKDAEG